MKGNKNPTGSEDATQPRISVERASKENINADPSESLESGSVDVHESKYLTFNQIRAELLRNRDKENAKKKNKKFHIRASGLGSLESFEAWK